MKKLFVSDVTLCTASSDLTFRERLAVAERAAKAGLNAIELPALGNDAEARVVVSTIAENTEDITVSINAGVTAEQIADTYDTVKAAKSLCLQIVLPVSTVQMEYTYHLKSAKMLDKIAALVSEAKKYNNAVEFVALDASRAAEGFIEQCCEAAVKNGATAITLCDTAGICFPEELAAITAKAKKVAGDAAIYVCPSNEMKMAAACAVAAIAAGADGVKTAVGDKGSLFAADLANIIRHKGEALGIESTLDVTAIKGSEAKIAEMVAEGETAADAVDAVLSADATLSTVTAEVKKLGYDLTPEDNGRVFEEFRRVTAKKQAIGVRELEAIIASSAMQVPSTYHLVNYVVNSGNIINATANVTLEKQGEQLSGVSIGDGPIDAAFHAIEQIIGHHYELDDFQIQAVTKGREAVGSSIIRLRASGKLYSGNGVSTDIIGACIRAYINALNKIVYEEK